MEIVVLRIGHRAHRDHRISTHCGLVARALGAKEIIYSGEKDDKLLESINRITEKWGGPFGCRYERSWKKVAREWKEGGGKIAHLTMYGMPIEEKAGEIRKSGRILIIVGGEKVPRDAYEISDWNISVTNQPHSEIAALAITLEKLNPNALKTEFKNARIIISPSEKGKNVRSI